MPPSSVGFSTTRKDTGSPDGFPGYHGNEISNYDLMPNRSISSHIVKSPDEAAAAVLGLILEISHHLLFDLLFLDRGHLFDRLDPLFHPTRSIEKPALLYHQGWSSDVPVQLSRGMDLDLPGGRDVSAHLSVDDQGGDVDFGVDGRRFTDDEDIPGKDLSIEFAVKPRHPLEAHLSLERAILAQEGLNISGFDFPFSNHVRSPFPRLPPFRALIGTQVFL